MAGSRSLSQRISEGDGISIVVRVADATAARAAEEQGAEAVAVEAPIVGLREATTLPVLWVGGEPAHDADAILLVSTDDQELGLECVVSVRDVDELTAALEQRDPEIFLLSAHEDADEDDDPIDSVLELLPDIPAGKLAIAYVHVETREDVLALERAGVDAVLVHEGDVTELVGRDHLDV